MIREDQELELPIGLESGGIGFLRRSLIHISRYGLAILTFLNRPNNWDSRVWQRFRLAVLLVLNSFFIGLVVVSAQTTAINNGAADKPIVRSGGPLRAHTHGGRRPETQGRARFFPVVAQPARKLVTIDVYNAPADERLLLLSLQGMVNRKQPASI